jgi:tetratricopeptide (TPR) repeat protein
MPSSGGSLHMVDLSARVHASCEKEHCVSRWLSIAAMLLVATGAHGLSAGEELSDYAKGLALRSEGKSRQAVEAFDRTLSAEPDNVQALTQKGAALEDLGRWKQAIAAYKQALTIDPNSAFARRNLEQLLASRMVAGPRATRNPAGEELLANGLLALQRKDFARARDIFRLASGLLADDPRGSFFWALTAEEQGKPDEAAALYRQTVELFPQYGPARINLILTLLASGQIAEANREASAALAAFPERPGLRALQRLVRRRMQDREAKDPGSGKAGAP